MKGKKNKKKKLKRKGFTLIELLAVIVIMGILMLVAIPAISRVIENSRKDTFVDIAKSYGNAARNLWTTDNLTCEGRISSAVDDGDYYILINTKDTAKDHLPVLLDQGGKSSWGNRDVSGYVRVNVKTIDGVDSNGDGKYEVEPKRTVKFYVALTDGTHGLIDNNSKVSDNLVRGDINMSLSEDELKKVALTVDDGRLDCGKTANGVYSCAEVTPIKNITGVCVDDQTSVGLTGNLKPIQPDLDIILAANTSTSKIDMIGKIENYNEFKDRYTIVEHGFAYIKNSRIGTRILTLNTNGRTKVKINGLIKNDGTFTYSMDPEIKSIKYAFISYIIYINDDGRNVTEISLTHKVSYNDLL